MVNDRVGVVLDRLRVAFDDERAVANAGLLLPATVASRLEIERLVDETVDLGERPGAARPGRKVLTLCHAMLLGADSIDDCDVLRTGRTGLVSGHRVLAPSTLGTFLRSFYVRARAPARPGACRDASPCLAGGRRPGRGAAGDRPRLVRRRGARLREGGCRLRVHAQARLSPVAGDAGWQRRGAAGAAAEGVGAHAAGRAALRR